MIMLTCIIAFKRGDDPVRKRAFHLTYTKLILQESLMIVSVSVNAASLIQEDYNFLDRFGIQKMLLYYNLSALLAITSLYQ